MVHVPGVGPEYYFMLNMLGLLRILRVLAAFLASTLQILPDSQCFWVRYCYGYSRYVKYFGFDTAVGTPSTSGASGLDVAVVDTSNTSRYFAGFYGAFFPIGSVRFGAVATP